MRVSTGRQRAESSWKKDGGTVAYVASIVCVDEPEPELEVETVVVRVGI